MSISFFFPDYEFEITEACHHRMIIFTSTNWTLSFESGENFTSIVCTWREKCRNWQTMMTWQQKCIFVTSSMIIDWIDHQRLESVIFVWEIEQMKLYSFILVFFSLKGTNFYGLKYCSSLQIFRKSCKIHKKIE